MDRVHWVTVTLSTHGRDVDIELYGNMHALAEHLGERALKNRSGRARAQDGLIEARVVTPRKAKVQP